MNAVSKAAPGSQSAAACDEHLPELMREVVLLDTAEDRSATRPMRVTRLDVPNSAFTCSCRKPASWYFRILREVEVTR